MAKEELLLNQMKEGQVYRRSDLLQYSTAIDRHLAQLLSDKKVVKVSGGLYLKPKASAFGAVPADDKTLVQSFLKDDRFLVNSYSNYTQLGLGLTQLYSFNVVYNYKRFGEMELGGKKYFFKRVPRFPQRLTKEFLLVDMLNNLKDLPEDENVVFDNLKLKKDSFDSKKVQYFAKLYGRPKTKKIVLEVYK